MTAFCPTLPEAPGARVLAALLRTDRDAGAHDELHGADGRLRPSWQRLFATLPADVADARAEIDARARQLAEEVHADGITHNVHGGTGTRGPARLWPLEALPLIVEPGDWVAIERGVVQRARLLDATMADLYGPQRLLHDALPPATLPYRRPGYLRALHGTVSPGGLHLHIVAFDLARGPDGHWWVVAQCCEDPSGQGHVLHNRLIVSRLFPDAFREPRVQQITSAYRRLLDTVEAQAAEVAAAGSPRIALPTAGPYSETCDEHALLARYLGVPVVEGDDLTVRDDRVFLKTVGGLEPVHALLGRLDDAWCDPLELRADSTLGVPGLLEAVRAGRVVVANALGSACLETPALQGILPAVSRALLGEDLATPSLPTWWCGEAAAAWHAWMRCATTRWRRSPRGARRPRRRALMRRVHADIAYVAASTRVDTPLAQVWRERRGVCQDFAHLPIGALRMLGLAARYVSGDLLTQPPPGEAALVGADASHAWVPLWCPHADGARDWLELDPTNERVPDLDHVRLAVGRDFGDVTPLKGVIRGGGAQDLAERVTTRRLDAGVRDACAPAWGTQVA